MILLEVHKISTIEIPKAMLQYLIDAHATLFGQFGKENGFMPFFYVEHLGSLLKMTLPVDGTLIDKQNAVRVQMSELLKAVCNELKGQPKTRGFHASTSFHMIQTFILKISGCAIKNLFPHGASILTRCLFEFLELEVVANVQWVVYYLVVLVCSALVYFVYNVGDWKVRTCVVTLLTLVYEVAVEYALGFKPERAYTLVVVCLLTAATQYHMHWERIKYLRLATLLAGLFIPMEEAIRADLMSKIDTNCTGRAMPSAIGHRRGYKNTGIVYMPEKDGKCVFRLSGETLILKTDSALYNGQYYTCNPVKVDQISKELEKDLALLYVEWYDNNTAKTCNVTLLKQKVEELKRSEKELGVSIDVTSMLPEILKI